MVIEPPSNFGRSRVFEVYDRILIARKLPFVKERSRAMNQAVILIRCTLRDAFAMKTRKQRCGARSVEAFIVIEDAHPQIPQLPATESGTARKLSIRREAQCVKATTAPKNRRILPKHCFACSIPCVLG